MPACPSGNQESPPESGLAGKIAGPTFYGPFKQWFHDRSMWREYLSMLAEQRFNRFSLTLGLGYNFPRNVTDVYFYFAYPFLLSVPGYKVRANPLLDAERDRNLETLRFIGDETVARGLQFQLGLWTHAYHDFH